MRIHIPLVQFEQTPRSAKKGVTLACSCATVPCRQEEVAALNVSWILQWGTRPQLFPGIESVPMIWDARSIGQPLGGNSAWLLGFNETDLWDQAKMTP